MKAKQLWSPDIDLVSSVQLEFQTFIDKIKPYNDIFDNIRNAFIISVNDSLIHM